MYIKIFIKLQTRYMMESEMTFDCCPLLITWSPNVWYTCNMHIPWYEKLCGDEKVMENGGRVDIRFKCLYITLIESILEEFSLGGK